MISRHLGGLTKAGVSDRKRVNAKKQTYDADLEIIAGSTQESLLLVDCFLWRHFLFYKE